MQQTGLNPSCPDNTRILLQKERNPPFICRGILRNGGHSEVSLQGDTLGSTRTPKWDPQPGLSSSPRGEGSRVLRGKMLEGGKKNLSPNEVRRFPPAGLCEAGPAPVSAGSQLTRRMLKGKWAFPCQLPSPNSRRKRC